MPPLKSNWLFYILFVGIIIILVSLTVTKADKKEMEMVFETIKKQGDTLLMESRKTNDLLYKISKK